MNFHTLLTTRGIVKALANGKRIWIPWPSMCSQLKILSKWTPIISKFLRKPGICQLGPVFQHSHTLQLMHQPKLIVSSEGSAGEGSDSKMAKFLEVWELMTGSHSHFLAVWSSDLFHQSVQRGSLLWRRSRWHCSLCSEVTSFDYYCIS